MLDYSFGAASFVMPNVLPKIGASVLGVNPYATTRGAIGAGEDLETRLKTIGDLVRTSGSDLGFVFDADGETATIVDDHGTPLTPEQALLVLVQLVCETIPSARIALPVSVSREAERIARAARRDDHVDEALGRAPHGGREQRRASTSPRRRRAASSGRRSCPPYDAAATLVHLLDLLAATDRPLSSVVAEHPRTAHRARSGADTVGAEGHGDARRDRTGQGRTTSCSSTA